MIIKERFRPKCDSPSLFGKISYGNRISSLQKDQNIILVGVFGEQFIDSTSEFDQYSHISFLRCLIFTDVQTSDLR